MGPTLTENTGHPILSHKSVKEVGIGSDLLPLCWDQVPRLTFFLWMVSITRKWLQVSKSTPNHMLQILNKYWGMKGVCYRSYCLPMFILLCQPNPYKLLSSPHNQNLWWNELHTMWYYEDNLMRVQSIIVSQLKSVSSACHSCCMHCMQVIPGSSRAIGVPDGHGHYGYM